ncbi:hypothetical protein Trydic_g1912 [Trypoxylus dichotomus]
MDRVVKRIISQTEQLSTIMGYKNLEAVRSHEEYDVALTKYKLAVQNRPDSVALWNNMGMCFYSKQKYIAAITCLKRALWLSPLNARVLLNLGMVHLSTQQPASAFNFLCAAVNLRPDAAVAFVLLGCTLMSLEDAQNALKAMRHALILAPEQPIVVLDTAVLCYRNGYVKEAAELVTRFEDLNGHHSNGSKEQLVSTAERVKALIAAGDLEQQEVVANSVDAGEMAGNGVTVTDEKLERGGDSGEIREVEKVDDDGAVEVDEMHCYDEELFGDIARRRSKKDSLGAEQLGTGIHPQSVEARPYLESTANCRVTWNYPYKKTYQVCDEIGSIREILLYGRIARCQYCRGERPVGSVNLLKILKSVSGSEGMTVTLLGQNSTGKCGPNLTELSLGMVDVQTHFTSGILQNVQGLRTRELSTLEMNAPWFPTGGSHES